MIKYERKKGENSEESHKKHTQCNMPFDNALIKPVDVKWDRESV